MLFNFHDSPFHVSHDNNTANKMAMKMDLSIMISAHINKNGWTQTEAAEILGVNPSTIADLKSGKIKKLTIDEMIDILVLLGFRINFMMSSLEQATISIEKDMAEA